MNSKFFLKSKSVWGIIIVALPQLWLIFPGLPAFDLATASQSFNTVLDSLNEIIGVILIIKGRIDAGKSEPTKLTLAP
jgi:hypothetical protein